MTSGLFETRRNMPHWCECDLHIQGAKEHVEEFLRLVKTEDSDLNVDGIIPYPAEFKELDRLAAEWEKVHPPKGEKMYGKVARGTATHKAGTHGASRIGAPNG